MSGIENILQSHGIGIALTGTLIVFVALTLIALFIAYLPKILEALSGILPPEIDHHATALAAPVVKRDDTELVSAIGFALHRLKTDKQRSNK